MKEKRYPFSMRRYGHNIELAYNHLFIITKEMESGEREWDDTTFKEYEELSDLYAKAIGCPVYWATGKEYGKLQEYSIWAENYRDRKNCAE